MKSKTILLIENDPEDQENFMNALYEISPTSGCYAVPCQAEAVKILDEGRLMPDLIFCSLHTPDLLPTELVSIITKNEKRNSIRLIFLTTDTKQHQRIPSASDCTIHLKGRFSTMKELLKRYHYDTKSVTIL